MNNVFASRATRRDYLVVASVVAAVLLGRGLGAQEQALVSFGDPFNYFVGTEAPSDPQDDWRMPDFDDELWEQDAETPIGYGEAIIKTPIPSSAAGNYLTVYFRKTFNVPDPAAFTGLSIELQFDDGFVAYINGTEVTRFNMGNVGEEFAFDRTSAGSHDFSAQPTTFDLRDSLAELEAGENLIAVEVHNRGLVSSDLVFNVELTATSNPMVFCPGGISCLRRTDGVAVSWVNHPTRAPQSFSVTRDGTPIAGSPFPGDTTSVLDPDGADGPHTYAVKAAFAAPFDSLDCPLLECTTGTEIALIGRGVDWRFFRGAEEPTPDPATDEPTTEWTLVDFDDTDWEVGPTGIGYGDGDDLTVLDDMQNGYLSVYMRHSFDLADASVIQAMTFRADYDDGYVAYLNGQEIARAGLFGIPPFFDEPSGGHEAGVFEEVAVPEPDTLLEDGTNVLAIQVHNQSIDSPDLSMIPELVYESDLCPKDLACSLSLDGREVTMTWRNVVEYDSIAILRDGETVEADIGGDQETYTDTHTVDKATVYQVVATVSGDRCAPVECLIEKSLAGCKHLHDSGGVREMLILGPIDLGGDVGPVCDDSGKLGTTDYLTDGEIGENNLRVERGDELLPDFGGLAGGTGVALAPNPDINPFALEGVLTVWLATADDEGLINFNDPDNVGDIDNYLIYSLTYLENTTGNDLEVLLRVGSDDGVKALLNGELVHLVATCRPPGALESADKLPVTLRPGRNTVLIAVVEKGGGTAVRLVVQDLEGFPLTGGRVVACSAPGEEEQAGTRFARGDVDADGGGNISDVVFLLSHLFQGGADPLCRKSADADDSGVVNIADAIFLLNFLFGGGQPLLPPAGDCGVDPTEDDLTCGSFPPCAG